MDDSSEIDLDIAVRVDELAGEFERRAAEEPGLTPEAFAADQDDVPREALLAVLRGVGVLARATRRSEGPFAPGDSVGPYAVRSVIGRGGMGIVYEAHEDELGRTVALKAMDAIHPDERTRSRFAREARAAARLDHPGIVPVHGSGETSGVLWYAMRRVDGASLDAVLSDLNSGNEAASARARALLDGAASSFASSPSGSGSSLPSRIRGAVSIVRRLADALAYAHAEGILHRDIKPANVLLDRSGAPLLTDFGLCRVDDEGTITAANDVVGTLRYMPPEALEGDYDVRGDVYSLGLVLYELVSGRPAFASDSRQTMLHQVLRVDPPPLRRVAPGAPLDLERVVAKATSKIPEERYATAAEFASDLEAVLAGRAVRARKSSALYLARLFVRRNRALSATLGLFLLATVVGTAFYVVNLRGANRRVSEALVKAEDSKSAADEALEVARAKEAETKAALALATKNAAEARIAGAEATLETSDVNRAALFLEQVDEEHRDWMWSHLAARTGLHERVESFELRLPQGVAQGADGEFLVVYGAGGVIVYRRDGMEEIGRAEAFTLHGAIGGDGRDFLCVDTTPEQLLHIRITDEGLERRVVCPLPGQKGPIAALEGSSLVAVRRGTSEIVGIDWRTGEELWTRQYPVPSIEAFALLAEDELALGARGGAVYQLRLDQQQPRRLGVHIGNVSAFLVEDGRVVASGADDGSVLIYNAFGEGIDSWFTFDSTVESFARALDGSGLIAVALWDRTVALIHPGSGAVERFLVGPKAQTIGSTFGVNPWHVTLTSAREVVWHDQESHDGRVELSPGLGDLGEPGVSPDGRFVATMGEDMILYLHDLEDRSVRRQPIAARAPRPLPSFDPSGERLVIERFVFGVEDLGLLATFGTSDEVVKSAFTREGEILAVGRPQKKADRRVAGPLTLTRMALGTDGQAEVMASRVIDGRTGVVKTLELGGDKALMVFGISKRDGAVECFDVQTLETVWVHRTGVARLSSIDVDVDRGEVYVAGVDGQVRVLDFDSGEEFGDRRFQVSTRDAIQGIPSSVALGPRSGQLVTCTNDGRVELWDAVNGRRIGKLSTVRSWNRYVQSIPGTDWVVATGHFGAVRLFGFGDVPTGSWTQDDASVLDFEGVRALYKGSPPMRPMLERACQRSQRFRALGSQWRQLLEQDDR